MTRQHLWTAAAVLGVLLLAGPAAAGQASMLNSSEASAFMGVWVISFESPRGGTFEQTLTVRDESGKVAARIGGGRGGGTTSRTSPRMETASCSPSSFERVGGASSTSS